MPTIVSSSSVTLEKLSLIQLRMMHFNVSLIINHAVQNEFILVENLLGLGDQDNGFIQTEQMLSIPIILSHFIEIEVHLEMSTLIV